MALGAPKKISSTGLCLFFIKMNGISGIFSRMLAPFAAEESTVTFLLTNASSARERKPPQTAPLKPPDGPCLRAQTYRLPCSIVSTVRKVRWRCEVVFANTPDPRFINFLCCAARGVQSSRPRVLTTHAPVPHAWTSLMVKRRSRQ